MRSTITLFIVTRVIIFYLISMLSITWLYCTVQYNCICYYPPAHYVLSMYVLPGISGACCYLVFSTRSRYLVFPAHHLPYNPGCYYYETQL